MGRGATKAQGNVWYQARISASNWDDRLSSRVGAAELLNVSEDAVKNTELGLEKCMPVEKAVLMADLYNAPNLLNYYCLHNCPIGCRQAITDEMPTIERSTVQLISLLDGRKIREILDKLVGVAQDGQLSDDGAGELREVVDYLLKVSKAVSGLQNIAERVKDGC